MTTTFKAGDKVEWESSQGTVTGKVKKKQEREKIRNKENYEIDNKSQVENE